jgi:hypothetical protein
MTRCTHCVVAAVAAAFMAAPASAEVFKWVDEQGVTHYSQQPPPEGAGTIIEPNPAPAAPAASDDGGNKGGDQGDADSNDDPTLAEFCDQQRQRAELLASDRPVRLKGEGDKLTTLEGEKRQKQLKQTRDQIRNHCQDT